MPVIIPPFTSASDRGYKFLKVFEDYFGSKGGEIGLYVEGGVAPYTWEVTGTDFTLAEAETDVQYNYVTVDEDCQIDVRETVTITDAEGSTAEIIVCTCNPYICCEDPEYAFSVESLSGTYEPGRSVTVVIAGGCPRFKWEIVSTDPVGEDANYSFSRLYTNLRVNHLELSEDADVETDVLIKITDSCGEITYQVVNTDFVYEGCCDAEAYVAPSIDTDNTDETVSYADPAVITIQGGCPPYSWEVVGDGYSLQYGMTIGLENVLSVADGSCDVEFAVIATVTITDVCDNSVSVVLRHVDGHWCYKLERRTFAEGTPCGSMGDGGLGYLCELHADPTSGQYRWKYTSINKFAQERHCVENAGCVWYYTSWPEGLPLPEDGYYGTPLDGATWSATCDAVGSRDIGVWIRAELHVWRCNCSAYGEQQTGDC